MVQRRHGESKLRKEKCESEVVRSIRKSRLREIIDFERAT